jgi:sugar/nucleoside kinase (ribokinase family)
MHFKSRTLDALRAARPLESAGNALVGFDGFVDTIVTAVDQRTAQGGAFTPVRTIAGFASRIAAAAGKSTNIELYPRLEKAGGNGPIMAGALLAAGTRVTCIGALGRPAVHPVFQELARHATVFPLCEPATTTAIEFNDGKLMFGQLRSLDGITLDAIESTVGADQLRALLAAADVTALVNWTMVPNMTSILRGLLDHVLPEAPARGDRMFFFDLSDPEKRTRADLLEALEIISRFGAHGAVILGLNLKEARRIHAELGFATRGATEQDLRATAAGIRTTLDLDTVLVHPRESAACATNAGTFHVPGPFTGTPLITTGAGDHFNAGFIHGRLLGLDPEACLCLGVCTSGHYVRTGISPGIDELVEFLESWS